MEPAGATSHVSEARPASPPPLPPPAASPPPPEPVAALAAPMPSPEEEAMLRKAAALRQTGRYVGLFALLAYAVLRRRRVLALLGTRLVDVVEEFAPWAAADCVHSAPRRLALFCRLVSIEQPGRPATVVARALRDDADLLNGNHWVAAVDRPAGSCAGGAPCHQPCGGSAAGCDADAAHCLAPLQRAAAMQGLACVRTQAAGDCAFDCMAYWDGVRRGSAACKRLRVEIAAFLTENAGNAQWQAALVATGEFTLLPLPSAVAGMRPCPESADASAQPEGGHHDREKEPEAAVLTAVASLCHLRSDDDAVARRLVLAMSEAERAEVLLEAEAQPASRGAALAAPQRSLRKRRYDGTLVLERAHGRLFADWCLSRKLDPTTRLPRGTMALFWKDVGGQPTQQDRYMVRQARDF
ncbi:MAG: hypothetical protein GY772_21575, partial [bacterium]|nr:hypothetical protein [bacterium]